MESDGHLSSTDIFMPSPKKREILPASITSDKITAKYVSCYKINDPDHVLRAVESTVLIWEKHYFFHPLQIKMRSAIIICLHLYLNSCTNKALLRCVTLMDGITAREPRIASTNWHCRGCLTWTKINNRPKCLSTTIAECERLSTIFNYTNRRLQKLRMEFENVKVEKKDLILILDNHKEMKVLKLENQNDKWILKYRF